jgi:cysteine desulfuration protein SufE
MSTMTLTEKQNELIEEFSIYEDWMDKYQYIIDLGNELQPLAADKKTKDRIIEGCQSQVWLDYTCKDNQMFFNADSDAIITKGIIALLIRVLNGEKPEEIVKADLFFIDAIGLHEHLSPTRSNGLASMVKKIKMESLKVAGKNL